MIRRALGLGLAVLAMAGVAAPALADTPAGPRLAFLQFSYRPDGLTIGTADAALGEPTTVAGGSVHVRPLPYPLSGPAWSSDGSAIAFSGMTGPVREMLLPVSRQIYVVEAEGAGLRAIPGTRGGFDPIFSPDGKSVFFAKTVRRILEPNGWFGQRAWKSTTVWSVGFDGKA